MISSLTCKYWKLIIMTYSPPPHCGHHCPVRHLSQVQDQNYLQSLLFPSISFLEYKLVFIAHKLFYASLPLQIIDNKIHPEQKMQLNLAAVFHTMILCFFLKNSISCKISVGAPVSGFSLPIVSLVSLLAMTVMYYNRVFLQSSEEVTL